MLLKCFNGRALPRVAFITRPSWVSKAESLPRIHAIKFILGIEFVDYGYQKMTVTLRADGFIINEKKVYRLMTAAGLLYSSKIGYKSGNRKFVQFYTQQASAPMQQLCMDIKYLYIHGAGRNALLLTVLDV